MREEAISMDDPPAILADGEARRDETELLSRLRAGDNSAYEDLVRENIARMLAVARRITRNEDDAQEAVQDAFLSAFRKIGDFDGRSALSTWMHRIVVNACLMKLRSKRRRPERSIEDMLPAFREDGHFARSPRDSVADVRERGLEELEARELVERALDRLPEAHRTVIVLRDIEELDTAEAAEMLGVSVDALKQRLHRARLALSRAIDELMEPAHGGA
ncbi:MAG: sigma-70 family RNA polymerase sigma factor [Phycisphaerales bacterium]|jgi:RNA polymerase sigma-70 factor (ECF subfamily)|nr:sigma-70 family RNA polymerase sigma factor [Phycisphaerales bacterium]